MFAPPPVQLTRAEIEKRRKRQSVSASTTSPSRSSITSAASDPRSPEALQRTASNTSKDAVTSPVSSLTKRSWFGHRREKSNTSSPLVTAPAVTPPQLPPPPPPPALEAPRQHPGDRAAARSGSVVDKPKTLSEAFGEHPRKAPAPPKRPPRPPSDVLPLPGAYPVASQPATTPPQTPIPATPPPKGGPPPIPAKSPQRAGAKKDGALTDPFLGKPSSTDAVLRDAVARVGQKDRERRASREGASFAGVRKNSKSKRRSGSFSGKSAAERVRDALSSTDELAILKPARRATEDDLQNEAAPVKTSGPESPPKRKQKKGETMSMLLDEGFFPLQEYIYNRKNPNISIQIPFPPPPSLLNKELPDTPSSIIPTLTELYQSDSPTKPVLSPGQRRKAGPKRWSPLAPIATNSAKNNGKHLPPTTLDQELSRLSAILEGSIISENTPPGSASSMSTPLATKIHLRGGSVITLLPPELSAWQKTYYIQGPIKLPKPTILPRKGSTASMEAFQEAIDQLYQEALNVPRRRSDDQIVDDVCGFFDDYGFRDFTFAGDVLGAIDMMVDETEGVAGEIEETGAEIERFATPPNEIGATPVEKVIAKEVVEHTIMLPPVETEETLRARGIARLSHGAPPSPTSSSFSRRASATSTIRKDSMTVLPPLVPVQKKSAMLQVPPVQPAMSLPAQKSREDVRMVDQGGFDWEDDVEELNGLSSWVAPAAFGSKKPVRGFSARESRNPVKKMRRFVATASAIL